MAAYAIAELTIIDRDKMADYIKKVPATITDHNGRYLTRGGNTEVLEGSLGEHPVKVILEFPSMDAARDWYNSAAYQAMLPDRLAATKMNFYLVEGV